MAGVTPFDALAMVVAEWHQDIKLEERDRRAIEELLERMKVRPATTRRDKLYELLRDAGPVGMTHREIAEHGINCCVVHIESLQFEGHAIESLSGWNGRGQHERRFTLVRDAWADEASEQAA